MWNARYSQPVLHLRSKATTVLHAAAQFTKSLPQAESTVLSGRLAEQPWVRPGQVVHPWQLFLLVFYLRVAGSPVAVLQ